MTSQKEPIRGTVKIDDPFYRYQMSTMNIQKERTQYCIDNLDKIASELKISSKDPIVTYIGKYVSSKINRDGKRITMSKHVDLKLLKESIYHFIHEFILCPKCKQPELSHHVAKKQLVYKCAACGSHGKINPTDKGQSALKKFIIVLKDTKSSKSTKRNKKNRRPKKTEKSKLDNSNEDSQNRSHLDILMDLQDQEDKKIGEFH